MSLLKALKFPHKTQVMVMTVCLTRVFLGGLSLDLFRASERSARQEKQREQAANLVETAIRELSPANLKLEGLVRWEELLWYSESRDIRYIMWSIADGWRCQMEIIDKRSYPRPNSKCQHCGRESKLISQALGLCVDCIRRNFAQVFPRIEQAHGTARSPFGLPRRPPRVEGGAKCQLCTNECSIAINERSYCGLRTNKEDKLVGATASQGNVSWYYDSLPTNCVADWVCPGCTGAGYPQFAYSHGTEYGYKNLAVFYQACSFDCLFCQNWQYRYSAIKESQVDALDLAQAVDDRTSCICYFGGDPSPQLPHALRASRLALKRNQGRILRICWETNGSMHPTQLQQAAELSLHSGGCIKFDLKAWSEQLNIALCGVSNKRTLTNFKQLAQYAAERPSLPFLVASTLLVPGYIDEEEISHIAAFIASLNRDIPYALLAFHPRFMMNDLPPTSRRHATECLEAAKAQGLTNVRLSNIHLLGDYY